MNPKVQSTAGKFTQNVRMTRTATAKPARPMQSGELASKNRWSSGHPRNDCDDALESVASRTTCGRDLRPKSRDPVGAGSWGARRENQPCAPQRRLRVASKIEPEGPEPDTRVTVNARIHGGDPGRESTAREGGMNRYLEGSWGRSDLREKAKPRASRVPSTTFDTGTRRLADANTKLTV